MAFTRDRIRAIMANESITAGEKIDQIFALHGQAITDGYVSKQDAEQMKNDAVKAVQIPDPKESDVYKHLDAEFTAYKTKQTARTSDDYKGIKPKFFDQVYDAIDRKEGAKPIAEQIADIKKNYAEYFEEEKAAETANPTFSNGTQGNMPSGGKDSFDNYWGFVPKTKE